MIISFAWTTDAVKARRKTVTRRDWSERHFQQWVKAYRQGRVTHDAYDRSPRIGGTKFGEIRLTCEPYKEALGEMPIEDLEAEGGYWMTREKFIAGFGGDPLKVVVVVRFYVLRFTPERRQLALPGF